MLFIFSSIIPHDILLSETKTDYILSMRNGGQSSWIGVRSQMEKDSSDAWARLVGWYVATIDGEEREFAKLEGK